MAIVKTARSILYLLLLCVMLASCGIISRTPKYRISDGVYTHRLDEVRQKVYIEGNDDSLVMTSIKDQTKVALRDRQSLSKATLDVDLLIAPFKYRPSTASLPRQLNTSFNGNIFVGYRVDHFMIERRHTAIGLRHRTLHTALTAGFFGGIGATPVNPWTTNYRITDEYDGFILSRGVAALVGFNSVTGGFALGFDYLTDRDKKIWIYQNKPWIGIVIGLHLN